MSLQESALQKPFWVVVANQGAAVIYTGERKRGPLLESYSLENRVARERVASLTSDRGGRSFDSHGDARHALGNEKSDPKRQASIEFARTIADRVVKAIQGGDCRGYALVAAPRFLGQLRNHLSTSAVIEPYLTVDKDVVGQDPTVIEKLLISQ